MSNLTELNLNNNEINEVNPLLNLTNLRVLNIQNNRLTESGGSIIDILKGNGIEIKHDVIPDSRSQKLLPSEEGKKQNRWLRSCMGGCFSCIGLKPTQKITCDGVIKRTSWQPFSYPSLL